MKKSITLTQACDGLVRYKTYGGVAISEKCQVMDKTNNPIANLYAAGACQGETPPNVHDVCAIGTHAGQQMAAAVKGNPAGSAGRGKA